MMLKRSAWVMVSVLVMLSLLVTPAGAMQAAGDLIIHAVDSVVNEDGESYSVQVLLSALDGKKQPINGLMVRDFAITEDSTALTADSVEKVEDLPINVIVVMDISGSMQGERLTNARQAIGEFIKSLYRGDRVAVYTFNETVNEVVGLTDDLNDARNTFDNAEIYAGGGTCLFDAAYAAAEKAASLPQGRQAVVVLSDGWDTINGSNTCSSRTIADIEALSKEAGGHSPIYTIGVGSDHDRDSMQRMADLTGGVYTYSNNATDLPELFEQLANRLSSEYVLTYTSAAMPGAHDVKITLDGVSQTVTVTLPGLAPVLSIAYPLADQVVEAGLNKIVLSIAERGLSVDTITFKINGVAIGAGGKANQAPYEYEIDFSQYEGQEITLTVAALDAGGVTMSEITRTFDFTVESQATATAMALETAATEAAADATSTPETCPEGKICIGALHLTVLQLVLVGVVVLLLIGVVVLLAVLAKKKAAKAKGSPAGAGKVKLFDEATLDNFALPVENMGRLTVLSSDDAMMVGSEYQLTKSPTTIGRSVSCDIALPKDSAVSRTHLEIINKDGKVMAREVLKVLNDGSKQAPTYGTYVNDRKIAGDLALNTGDEISLGRRTKLRYEAAQRAQTGDSEDVTFDGLQAPDAAMDDATRDG